MLLPERIGGRDDNHLQFVQQDDQLPAVPPREVDVMVARTGCPPLIAVPEVVQVATDVPASTL